MLRAIRRTTRAYVQLLRLSVAGDVDRCACVVCHGVFFRARSVLGVPMCADCSARRRRTSAYLRRARDADRIA